VKLDFRAIAVLIVIGLAFKACSDDNEPRTGKGSRVGTASTPAPAIQNLAPPVAPLAIRYVGPSSLNVRSHPNGKVVGSLRHGDSVAIHGESGGWSRISPDQQPEKWVSSTYLCEIPGCADSTKWKPVPAMPSAPIQQRRTTPPAPSSYTSCPCSSSSNCYGPRGGRYCITSGGNKLYR